MENTDSNEELHLTVDEGAETQKAEELPKAWTDDDRAKYRVVRAYLNSVDEEVGRAFAFQEFLTRWLTAPRGTRGVTRHDRHDSSHNQ